MYVAQAEYPLALGGQIGQANGQPGAVWYDAQGWIADVSAIGAILRLDGYPTCHHTLVMNSSRNDDRYYYPRPGRHEIITNVDKW